jgi:hypothetical protein
MSNTISAAVGGSGDVPLSDRDLGIWDCQMVQQGRVQIAITTTCPPTFTTGRSRNAQDPFVGPQVSGERVHTAAPAQTLLVIRNDFGRLYPEHTWEYFRWTCGCNAKGFMNPLMASVDPPYSCGGYLSLVIHR